MRGRGGGGRERGKFEVCVCPQAPPTLMSRIVRTMVRQFAAFTLGIIAKPTDCLSFWLFTFKDSGTLLEIEFMKCELAVKSLGEKKENYSKSVVEVSCSTCGSE